MTYIIRMLITENFSLIFFIIIVEIEVEVEGEFVQGYRIKEGMIPTYLNYTFTNLPEEVFPADITIEMSLSRMPGTLLYSVDSNNNQMIVSITDGHTPSLDIEFSKEHQYFSLSKLCNLEYPRFTKLKLRIQMRELMYIQCNDGLMESAKYQRTGILNKDYPIPRFGSKTDKLQAYLWLVNTPSGDGVHSNSDQLSGCIFKVHYKKQQLTMGTYQTEDRCPITCTNNICNTGQCLETYNSVPICNCTSSFHNGQYCNDSLHTGIYLMTQKFQFKTIKLAFNSSSDNILEFNAKNVNVKLFSDDTSLKVRINCTKQFKTTIESTITENYNKTVMHLVIIVFDETRVVVQYYLVNSSWYYIRIPHDHDLSRVLFEFLRLEGDEIDISYKNDVKELRWSKMDIKAYQEINKSETIIKKDITKLSSNGENKRSQDIRDLDKKLTMNVVHINDFIYLNLKVSWILAVLIILFTIIIFLILLGVRKMILTKKLNRNIMNQRNRNINIEIEDNCLREKLSEHLKPEEPEDSGTSSMKSVTSA